MSTDPKFQAFAARLAAKLGMDPEHRYWVSKGTTFGFVDVSIEGSANVVMGSLWKSDTVVYYSQYQPLTMDLLQDHFGTEIVVNETDPKILADHFSEALLVSVVRTQDDGFTVSYDSGGLSFLGARPLVLVEAARTEINTITLQLVDKLKDCVGHKNRSDAQLEEVEARFLELWKKNNAPEPTKQGASSQEAASSITTTEPKADPPVAKRSAAPTKKTVKRPKINKKKKKAAGLKFEGED